MANYMREYLALLSVLILLQGAGAAELPVRRVILYKHGIGYFERAGEIPSGASARLDFKAAEMNDVLKSLTINDQSGNSVAGVRYDSSLPLSEKLKEFPFSLRERSPLVDFLDQLKGASIELKLGASSVTGQIVGARILASEKPQTNVETISILTGEGKIVTHDLASAGSLQFSDPELQRQLADYLRSLNASRSREQKSVYIDSAKDAARKLSVAYTIPMPVWKSTYRLVLDAGAQKKPQLEGWAIIDNTTNEDWSRVDLSVISGRPISFISNLYTPKFAERQVAELAEAKPLAPTVYKTTTDMRAGGTVAGFQMAEARMAAPPPPAPLAMAMNSSVEINTTTREAGELFEYKFGQPVTVKRNESAMLPFVQQEIQARKLLIYTQGSQSEHPLNSAELTNSTGKTLDGGPLSVYDGGVYAGEALVNTFKAGDKRLLSYAQDLGTRIVEDSEGGERLLREVKASRGVLSSRFVSTLTTNYKISNVDRKAKTLIIEHPVRADHTLQGVKPAEQTATHYRFEVKLTGDANQTLTVKEQYLMLETQQLSTYGEEYFEYLQTNGALPAAAKQFFAEAASLRRQIADSENQLKALNQQISDANGDTERLRRNLSSLNGVSGQQERVQKYASDLAALDSNITSMRTQIASETKKRDELKRQLAAKLESASF